MPDSTLDYMIDRIRDGEVRDHILLVDTDYTSETFDPNNNMSILWARRKRQRLLMSGRMLATAFVGCSTDGGGVHVSIEIFDDGTSPERHRLVFQLTDPIDYEPGSAEAEDQDWIFDQVLLDLDREEND